MNLDRLVAAARAETGLHDLGDDDGVLHAAGALIDILNSTANLNDFGTSRLRGFIFDKLCVRLKLEALHHQHQDLRDQDVVAPIFIVGLPRVGSTLMHHLFAQNPAIRTPLRWEMMQPFPPPETATYRTDPRIAAETDTLRPIIEGSPEIYAMHPMRGDFPEECMHILTGHFMSSVFMALTGAVEFDRLMRTWDLAPAYRFHKQYLQLLQWKAPGTPWVLKSPMHTGYIEAINAVYPDARFVWLHRNPADVLVSWCQLTLALQERHVVSFDPAQAAADKVEEWHWHVAAGEAQRRAIQDESRFVDVDFGQFISSPANTMRQLHDWAGLSYDEALARATDDYVVNPPYPRGGYTKKTADDFGLTTEAIDEQFAHYRTWAQLS